MFSLYNKINKNRLFIRYYANGNNIHTNIPKSLQRIDHFVPRHIGANINEEKKMLSLLGFDNMNSFLDKAIPKEIRLKRPLKLPLPLTESQALDHINKIADKNKIYSCYLGQGYSVTLTPSVIQRNILENPGWYTSYTPYQAEISQGRLESLLNYQTMISDLTKLPIANASLLDEGTAAAEGMNLAYNIQNSTNSIKNDFFISKDCHPQTIAVVKTRAQNLGIHVTIGDIDSILSNNNNNNKYFGFLFQYPNTYGHIINYKNIIQLLKQNETNNPCIIMSCDLLALTKLTPPGELGADVAIGNSQRFGVPLMYGGPHAGFISVKDKYLRKLPGRIIGISIDNENNKKVYRMAMQTREQHIRRDRATSNICTAQALLANMAAFYAIYHGPEGLKKIANRIHHLTSFFIYNLIKDNNSSAYQVLNKNSFFDTVHISLNNNETSDDIQKRGWHNKINIRKINSSQICVSFGESITLEDVQKLLQRVFLIKKLDYNYENSMVDTIPKEFIRNSSFLMGDVFNKYHSETLLLRYIKHLEKKDLSLVNSMISLGSCTMKLNSTSELIPITNKKFTDIHPFVPKDQAKGYHLLINELHSFLQKITGFSAASSQPNSGAQGEFAGLLAIKNYLMDPKNKKNNDNRNIVLIPASAHGTNPASAVMAGFKVVVIKNNEHDGLIDEKDLDDKIKQYTSPENNKINKIACLMITYPSTYGIFEKRIKKITKKIHQIGGLVYMDGANMNAQVGLCNPYELGADVCHLNLHKTFCIPHGGGGPGVGTIAVSAKLMKYLPKTNIEYLNQESTKEILDIVVSSAPYGSAGILPISYMYIKMCGDEGLKKNTSFAILNANYMAKRLSKYYKILFYNQEKKNELNESYIAHEFILDVREFKSIGVTEEDIAKRLIDYGFHGPTMSWPVPGTLMIEPTESESLEELERFITAMIYIRKEIQFIQDNKIEYIKSPLKYAPHTMESVLLNTKWDKSYTKEEAVFPAPWQKKNIENINNGKNNNYILNKFWPTVGRVNNVFGDRNLICSCPAIESYEEKK